MVHLILKFIIYSFLNYINLDDSKDSSSSFDESDLESDLAVRIH